MDDFDRANNNNDTSKQSILLFLIGEKNAKQLFKKV